MHTYLLIYPEIKIQTYIEYENFHTHTCYFSNKSPNCAMSSLCELQLLHVHVLRDKTCSMHVHAWISLGALSDFSRTRSHYIILHHSYSHTLFLLLKITSVCVCMCVCMYMTVRCLNITTTVKKCALHCVDVHDQCTTLMKLVVCYR